jgi:hypothetical protein
LLSAAADALSGAVAVSPGVDSPPAVPPSTK